MQFTPRHLIRLSIAESPFAVGGQVTGSDIALFVFSVSVSYPSETVRERIIREVAPLDYKQCFAEINEYLEDANGDCPSGSAGSGPQVETIASEYASIVHRIASAYGWSESETLDIPYARLWQYLKLIRRDLDPKATMDSRVHKYARRRLAQIREEQNGNHQG